MLVNFYKEEVGFNLISKPQPGPILLTLFCVIFTSCARICTIPVITVEVKEKQISFGPSTFPCDKMGTYESAVKLAILAIYSQDFEDMLSAYIRDSLGNGEEHVSAWGKWSATAIVDSMRHQINGEYVATYGGIQGWWWYKTAGNLAFDGDSIGPIRINRIPLRLKSRDAPSISNTIAHETAHRIGLEHPHSKSNMRVAQKEPPYVIGYIIGEIAKSLSKK